MDAKVSVFILMKKLPLMFPTIGDSSFGEQIKNNLQSLNQLLRYAEDSEVSCVGGGGGGGGGGDSMDDDDDQKTARILQALYSAVCAIDSFRVLHWMSKSSNRFSLSMWFKSLRSKKHFIIEMKGFNEKLIRCLSSDDHFDAKNEAASSVNDTEDVLNCIGQQQQQRWGRISGLCEETDVICIRQETTIKLRVRLTDQRELNEIVEEVHVNGDQLDHSSVKVIAVTGEGGSGKTTLARSVYNRVDVRRHFTNRAWVRVPDVFKARDVLAEIVKQIDQAEFAGVETLSAEDLVWKITKLLDGTRFLIVLDDVNTSEVWETLLVPICSSSSQSGGRIIVTTRDSGSFPGQATYSALHLGRLNEEESWKLFSNKVRITEDELNNSEMITLKDQILNICGGLPSTIALLGGLLSTKRHSHSDWSSVIVRAYKPGGDMLALSYQDLPSPVKPCFIYMGIFPRGFEVPVRRLFHLWCAEGFMTPSITEKLDREDLEEICLEELVIRNMVEVRWRLDGTPKTCCMPNFLYEFFSRKAANAGFFYQHFHQSSPESSGLPKLAVWRLAAYLGIKHFPYSQLDILNLRSYTAFDTRVRGTPAREIGMLLNKIVTSKGFGLLTVLDLEGVYKPKLSDDVMSKMLLLSYLGLRSTFIDELPAAVTDLAYLETLDLKHTNIRTKYLTFKSERLRHVYLNSHFNFEYLGMRSNSNMQTLWGVYYIIQRNFIRKWVQSFTRLRKLKLIGWPTLASNEIAEWISKLTSLETLKLVSISDDSKLSSSITLCTTLKEHHKLQNLYLVGILPKSVFDVGFLPPNLSKLTLSLSQLCYDPMLLLGGHQLQHLKILRLFGCIDKLQVQMTCPSNGFPKLQLLQLWNLPIKKLIVEAGAMPCLRELEIRSCQHLGEVTGLQNVNTLKELVLTNMPNDFGAKVEKFVEGGDAYIRYNTWSCSPPFMGPNYRNERSKDWAPYDV